MRGLFGTFTWRVLVTLTSVLLTIGVCWFYVIIYYSLRLFDELNEPVFQDIARVVEKGYFWGGTALFLVCIILVAAVTDMVSFHQLVRRFRAITRVVLAFAGGNYQIRVRVEGNDEISRLGSAFNEMADTVVASITDIQRTDQMRRELVENVAHDINSPLTSIQGYVETLLLKNEQLTTEQREEFLRVVLKNTESLVRLVSDLLHLAKLDNEIGIAVQDEFNLGEVAAEVVQELQPLADKKKIKIDVDHQMERHKLTGDTTMIRRAILNIVDNAIKFCSAGDQVVVAVHGSASEGSVTVKDSGPGISAEDLPHLTERFYRADKDRSRETGGSGLGLAIVKRILELHGSSLELQSKLGEGTSVSFTLSDFDVDDEEELSSS